MSCSNSAICRGGLRAFLATGRARLLKVALRNAALVRSVFNPNGRHDMCGHQIVEMGLARLYRITQDRSLLETARFFLEERGRHESRPLYSYADNPGYSQDHIPVREQSEAVGHAVRAAYMYCGMADVAALFPDDGYAAAITAIWRDVVGSKTVSDRRDRRPAQGRGFRYLLSSFPT